ncbi:MAG: hypothetical protein A3F68_13490 [Acidobacteria bacterium RIFCSPLOWO2_12_FULL_54_10]|nr:MAG: hypothetical protein A3F68_13490 [Acidobacteria bacterium RIFCSPLOWO2_12_FULL_54_10]
MNDIQAFLSSTHVFKDVPPEDMAEIAPLFRVEKYAAGEIILRQGGYSDAVYFLRSGRLAARFQRGEWRETVAHLQPPDIFGELSFVTGKPCVCDVEVVFDAEVVCLPKAVIPDLSQQLAKSWLLVQRCLMNVIAGRLQDTVVRGAKVQESPIVLLRNSPHWEAPLSFAAELSRSLKRQTGKETLLINLGSKGNADIHSLGDGANVCDWLPQSTGDALRSDIAQRLTEWRRHFENVVINIPPTNSSSLSGIVKEFVNWQGDLLGPGDPVPQNDKEQKFVVQSAAQPTLPVLSGTQQLIHEAQQSEASFRSGASVTPKFRRTVDSIARALAGLQVGLALGGGAAWGWAHIGVLSILEESGLPIDVISGCSMGSVIGAFRSAGYPVSELIEIATYWKKRTKRFIEWRFWRMCLLNERVLRKTFRQYFGDRPVNSTEIPYWANAVDIQTGKEFSIQDGSLVDCVRASIAMPGLLPPATRGAALLVDAAAMDPVPVDLLRKMGCHYAIAVNAMAAPEAQKVSSRYPFNAFDIMSRCMFILGHEIGQARAEQSANVVFTPMLNDISMLQFSRSQEIIECGMRAAKQNLPMIMAGYERLRASLRGADHLPPRVEATAS